MKRFLLTSMILLIVFSTFELYSKKITRKTDSLELVKFYNETDGKNWFVDTGWSDGKLPVWEWHGVGIDWIVNGNDTTVVVIEIELEKNNLSGVLPILNLQDLYMMFVSGNNLRGTIPAYNSKEFSWFDVSHNKYLFEDFMPNLEFLMDLDVFIYDFQDTIINFKVTKNTNNLFVEHEYKHEGNKFNWKINNVLVPNYIKDTITVTTMLAEIKCEVSNSKVPNLYYKSEPYQIKTELISPLDNTQNLSNIELRWKYIDISQKYLVKSIISFSGSTITRYDTTDKTIFKYPAGVPQFNSNFKWSVAPLREKEVGAYTNEWTFTTTTVNEFTDATDSLELVRFFNQSNGSAWNNKNNWLSSQPVWKWQGIKTYPEYINGNLVHRVLRISLSSNKVLFKELDLNLPFLDTLVLSYNATTYSINESNVYLPNLRYLNISGNKLENGFTAFNKFPKLEYLNISNSSLTSLNGLNLNNLINLLADGNNFSNESYEFNLPNLFTLSLKNCKIAGIFSNLNLPKLAYLYLSNNDIGGFANNTLPELKYLDVSTNKIGNINNLNNLNNLQTLYINKNLLAGELTNFNFPALKSFYGSNNQLSGKIDLTKMPVLTYLDLSSNAYEGTPEIVEHDSIKIINFSSNKFSGQIPEIDLPNLTSLYLGNNNFTKVGKMKTPKLQDLMLNNNLLSDTVPDFISNYPNMKSGILSLGQNLLTYEHFLPNHYSNNQIKTYIISDQKVTYKLKITKDGSEFGLEPDYNGIADKFLWIDQYNSTLSNGRLYYKNKPINQIRCKISYTKITGVDYYTEFFDPNPKKLYPENNATEVEYQPEFKWTKVDYATKYWVLISETQYMNPANVYETTDTVLKLPVELSPNKKYYWVLRFFIDESTGTSVMANPWPFSTLTANVTLNQKDSLALVKIYNSLDGPNWSSQLNWLSNEPATKWGGLVFKTHKVGDGYVNYVSQLSLVNNKLKGEIDKIELDSLNSLVINNNEISGKFPELTSEVITQISAPYNKFESGITNTFKNSISYIDLSYNSITEEIEEVVGDKLNYLFLNNNDMTGYFPSIVAPSLKYIVMSYNKLDKILPVVYHDSIRVIRINNNNFNGNLPEFNTPLIDTINLSNNQFYGTIPAYQMDRIKNLDLSYNNLSGNIPAFDMVNLAFLNLSRNKLSGTIPKINSNALRTVNISYNKFLFEDLTENATTYMPINSFLYYPQDTLLELIPSENNGQYYISVGINANNQTKFKWYEDGQKISDTTKTIKITNQSAKYKCEVSYLTFDKLILETVIKSYQELIVSVDDIYSHDKFRITPNPSSEYFIINTNYYNETPKNIRIYDVSGTKVMEFDLDNGQNLINIKDLSIGVYFIFIDNEIKPLKLIKY